MHEMSLAESILQIAEDTARRENARRIKAIALEIGALASVEIESLRFCFAAVIRGSLAEGARLEIQTVPGQGWCLPCGRSIPLPEAATPCPHCGSYQIQATAGTEMKVKEIEIE